MERKREPRAIGEKLLLGETEYRIEEVEGYGGSAVVYRASYQDRLNPESIHRVLIKELFPYHSKGFIYRDAKGNICCMPEGKVFMEQCGRSFYLGNQANLNLLARMPEQISGNINSYAAYGTFYSVLPVHGGDNLKNLLEKRKYFQTLKETALCIKKILSAVESFHKNGLLHLDISPDNILMLSSHALLIDYNSVQPLRKEEGSVYYFSEKQGYSAPEIRLKEIEHIGPASDLYSVSAVFFQMLTGRILLEETVREHGILKSLPKNLEIFRGEPVSAAYKAVQIVKKGLHILARKRYQTTAEMQKELDELIRRIDGRGVSYSAIWEGSVREWEKQKQMDGQYLKRTVEREDGNILLEKDCRQMLLQGENILLKGTGGMGKTQFLLRLWENGIKEYHDAAFVTVYIPLYNYQKYQGGTDFIRSYLLCRLCRLERGEPMEEARQELERLLDNASERQGGFLFLLDGLNEAGERRAGLLKEAEELGRKDRIGILVTDRSDFVKKYALHGFWTAKLLPLTKKEVTVKLAEYGVPIPDGQEFLELFENPMMLDLYRKSLEMEVENEREERSLVPKSMNEMVAAYLENLCVREMRRDFGNQAQQLLHGFCIRHLLPDIAGEMKRRKKTLFTMEELYVMVRKSYRTMQKKSFAMAFPEYMGKTRLMLREIANEREWFDYAVSEQLIGSLDLMEENGAGGYRLIHDNFIPYLAGVSKENRKKICRYRVRENCVKTGIGTLLAILILAAGISTWKSHMPPQLTEEEDGIVYSAMLRTEINTGICNDILRGQNAIIEMAEKEGTLKGKQEDRERLFEIIEEKTKEAESAYLGYRDGNSHLKNMEDMGKYVPLDELQDLYQKPKELKEVTEKVMEQLKQRLCQADSIYDTYDKRKPLIEAYRQYIEAYTAMCGAQYSQIVYCVQEMQAERAAEEMMDAAGEMLAVGKYIHYNSQVEISDALTKAERQLKDAVRTIERQGLL